MSKRRRRSGGSGVPVELLEECCYLAGNVSATLKVSGSLSTLTIIWDAEANVIEISMLGTSSIVIAGIDTSINGTAEPKTFPTFGTLLIDMKGGDDQVALLGVLV